MSQGPESSDALPPPTEAAGAPRPTEGDATGGEPPAAPPTSTGPDAAGEQGSEGAPADGTAGGEGPAEERAAAKKATTKKAATRGSAAKKAATKKAGAKKAATKKAASKKATATKAPARKRAAKAASPAAATSPVARAAGGTSPAGPAGALDAIAVVPVRDGHLPLGGDEAVAEAGGRALLVGDGAAHAAEALVSAVGEVLVCEQPAFAPGAWASGLAEVLRSRPVVIVPASPDGRDLAPRLAAALERPLLAGAVAVHADGATVARRGGLVTEAHVVTGPFVATLQPGVRGVDRRHHGSVRTRAVELAAAGPAPLDAELVELLPADPSTMDLAEAPRLIGAGAGIGSAGAVELVAQVAEALGASTGGTRVITDWGWMPVDRQIGTTGVTVQPELYLAFGISGAVQHTAGLGQPEHIVSVNLDGSCPMMAMADLAVVADAPATLEALARKLGAGTEGEVAAVRAEGDDHELQPSLPAGAVPTETVPIREGGTRG